MASPAPPLLDAEDMLAGSPAFDEALRSACHSTGFFYLRAPRAHGSRLGGALRAAEEFFALPEERKTAMDIRLSPHFRGYIRLGAENTRGVVDFREQVEFGPEEEPPAAASGSPFPSRKSAWLPERLRGPNQWPAEACAPRFRPRMTEFCEAMMDISRHLTRSLARSLRMPSSGFDPLIGPRPHWQMKIVKYPPAGESTVGVGAHSDSGFLTFVLQGGGASCLQAEVQGHPGAWMDVPPKGEDVLVVNLGEMLMLMTDGYYVATRHRVLNDPHRSRFSVPFFFNPSLSAVVEPLPAAALRGLPWERDRSLADRQRSDERNAIFRDYGMNAFKSLFRSHPEVSARHHPDLELLPSGDVRPRG